MGGWLEVMVKATGPVSQQDALQVQILSSVHGAALVPQCCTINCSEDRKFIAAVFSCTFKQSMFNKFDRFVMFLSDLEVFRLIDYLHSTAQTHEYPHAIYYWGTTDKYLSHWIGTLCSFLSKYLALVHSYCVTQLHAYRKFTVSQRVQNWETHRTAAEEKTWNETKVEYPLFSNRRN